MKGRSGGERRGVKWWEGVTGRGEVGGRVRGRVGCEEKEFKERGFQAMCRDVGIREVI